MTCVYTSCGCQCLSIKRCWRGRAALKGAQRERERGRATPALRAECSAAPGPGIIRTRPFPPFTFSVCSYYCHTSSTPHARLLGAFYRKMMSGLHIQPVCSCLVANGDLMDVRRRRMDTDSVFRRVRASICTFASLFLLFV